MMKRRKKYIPFLVIALTYLALYVGMRCLDYKRHRYLISLNDKIETISIKDEQLTPKNIYLQAIDMDPTMKENSIFVFYRDGKQRFSPDVELDDKVLKVKAFDFTQFPSDSLLIIQYNSPVTIYLNDEVIYTPEEMSRVSWDNLNREIPSLSTKIEKPHD